MALQITEENFDEVVLKASQPVLIDFWAEWCGPCKMITPIIDQIATELDGIAIVGKVNVDTCAALATRFNVRSIPTLVFLKNGQVVDTVMGAGTPKATLIAKLKALV